MRKVGGAQFRDIGDGGPGVERQAKDVGVHIVFTFRRASLTGGDGRDAGGAEVGPDDARADKSEMGGNDEARQLLVRIVGQREDDPRRLRPRFERADLDAADDAVGSRRGRNLNAIALRTVMFDRAGQVDGVSVHRHAHGVDGEGGAGAKRGPDKQEKRQ